MKNKVLMTFSIFAVIAATESYAAEAYHPYYMQGASDAVSAGAMVFDNSATQVAPEMAPMIDPAPMAPLPPAPQVNVSREDFYSSLSVYTPTAVEQPQYNYMAHVGSQREDSYVTIQSKPKPAQVIPLDTRSGMDIALQISNYHYREPSLDMSLAGEKGGIDIAATKKFYGKYFATLNGRFVLGVSDYSSANGRTSGHFEGIVDVRALAGRDFIYSRFGISPYVGIAYRTMYSDIRGTAPDGSKGYRRLNQLYYIPIGFTQRTEITPENHVSIKLEYDHAFAGSQTSYLTDVSAGYPDLDNTQHHGTGYRAEIMWERPRWSIGPFVSYWAVADSELKTDCGISICLTGHEPHNNTIEAGLQVRFRPFK